MKLTNVEIVEEMPYGLYLCLSDGKYVVDEDHNYLCIDSTKGNQSKIDELINTAKALGLKNISVQWRSGARMVTDSEYDEQMSRLQSGLVPDVQDVPAMIEYLGGEYNG